MIDISIIIPLLNEDESLPELHDWIVNVMTASNFTYEIIFIDDGSKDKSWEIINTLAKNNASVKGIKFRSNYGKSAALNVGFETCVGNVIFTMDADLQDSPEELPAMYKRIIDEDYDLISGWKKKRYDPITKTIPTKLFNAATRAISGIKLNDFNCGLKAYKKEVVKNIEVYGEMHRYIPVIAKWQGFSKIGEHVVQHRARKYGTTKFGLERFVNGFLDLLSIFFVGKFGKKPMHFFGVLGTISFMVGFFITAFIGFAKLWAIYHQQNRQLIAENPYFYIALCCMIIGVQLFTAGFLGELVSRNNQERNKYNISATTFDNP